MKLVLSITRAMAASISGFKALVLRFQVDQWDGGRHDGQFTLERVNVKIGGGWRVINDRVYRFHCSCQGKARIVTTRSAGTPR